MMIPALRYLTLRSLGAPAVLLSLAMQGVFRGFKDTRTPLYTIGIINIHIPPECALFRFINDATYTACFDLSGSGGRSGEHHTGSDPDIRVPHGRDRRSHCPCSFSVKIIIPLSPCKQILYSSSAPSNRSGRQLNDFECVQVPDNADNAEQACEEGRRRPAQPKMPQVPAIPRMR
jgi:hypothetical protein